MNSDPASFSDRLKTFCNTQAKELRLINHVNSQNLFTQASILIPNVSEIVACS